MTQNNTLDIHTQLIEEIDRFRKATEAIETLAAKDHQLQYIQEEVTELRAAIESNNSEITKFLQQPTPSINQEELDQLTSELTAHKELTNKEFIALMNIIRQLTNQTDQLQTTQTNDSAHTKDRLLQQLSENRRVEVEMRKIKGLVNDNRNSINHHGEVIDRLENEVSKLRKVLVGVVVAVVIAFVIAIIVLF